MRQLVHHQSLDFVEDQPTYRRETLATANKCAQREILDSNITTALAGGKVLTRPALEAILPTIGKEGIMSAERLEFYCRERKVRFSSHCKRVLHTKRNLAILLRPLDKNYFAKPARPQGKPAKKNPAMKHPVKSRSHRTSTAAMHGGFSDSSGTEKDGLDPILHLSAAGSERVSYTYP